MKLTPPYCPGQLEMMKFSMEDRIALVTGASKGIGKAIAEELARQGARVVLVARSADLLDDVASKLAHPQRHTTVAADLTTPSGIEQTLERTMELGSVDIVVHNLGGSAGTFDPMAPAEEWQKVWHFNLGICHELNRALLPPMIERRWGRIVHLSTLSTSTYSGYAPYVSAKCALTGYIKSMARTVAKHNVIISAVAPGAIYSEGRHFAKLQKENPEALEKYFDEHLPTRRLGSGADVAAAVSFLCSEEASFMAGSIVAVDGGGM
jgi:3-oxoacyl-[acyl-carrier protein] reductase